MFIENINENIREYFSKRYYEAFELEEDFTDDFLEQIELIKEKKHSFYERILQSFYPIFYISNLERIGEIESLKKLEIENDAEDEFVYDVEFLKEIASFDMLIDEVEKEPLLLVDMLVSNLIFHNQSELEKRGLLVEYKECDEYLKKISKTWIFDRMDYCRKYTKEEFFNRCLTINSTADSNNDYSVMIDSSIEYLKELSIFDIDAFLDLFNFILEDSYIYLKYQSLIDKENINLVEFIDRLKNIYQHTEENILNDKKFMMFTIKAFFMYNLYKETEKEKIKRILEEKKMLLKKSNKK